MLAALIALRHLVKAVAERDEVVARGAQADELALRCAQLAGGRARVGERGDRHRRVVDGLLE